MTEQVRGAAFPREFPGVVIEVTDGDSIKMFLDRGGDDWWPVSVRLHGIACRERADVGGPEALAYTARLVEQVTPPRLIDIFNRRWQAKVHAVKWDKYAGRIQGLVYLPGGVTDVSTLLLRAGYAAPWDGRGAQPRPPWPIPEGTP